MKSLENVNSGHRQTSLMWTWWLLQLLRLYTMNLLVDDRRSPASMELNHENNAFKRPSGYRVYA